VRGSLANLRKTYIKFDLHSYSGVIVKAYLKITINRVVAITGGGTNHADIFTVANDNWIDSALTWNNTPVRNNYLLTQNFPTKTSTAPDTSFLIDITNYVKSEYSGDKILSLCMVDTSNNGTDVRFWSSRVSTRMGPELVISSQAPTLLRYRDEIFTSNQLQSNIQYGAAGSTNLYLDFYSPTGDTATKRPLVIFIHGGGFKSGDKVSGFGSNVCTTMVKRGYVLASINYRLVSSTTTLQEHFEAMIKALQDAKAAVRFFRMNAAQYGIDTSQIFVTGSSAGSHTALHMAYLDESEVPSYVNLAGLGGLEGNSGNLGYSSRVTGVISNWGALGDFHWMKPGDVPVYCVHGLSDVTVPCDSSFADGPFHYCSLIINAYAQQLGIKTGITTFPNTGHTLDNDDTKQLLAIKNFSDWLYTCLRQYTGISPESAISNLPQTFQLEQNYPNPFNPVTMIGYQLHRESHISLKVYDILGNEIQTLTNGTQPAGRYSVPFNVAAVPSGIYFYVLDADGVLLTKKMIVMK
jgi:predicted esterase